jgi:hypothetical protein
LSSRRYFDLEARRMWRAPVPKQAVPRDYSENGLQIHLEFRLRIKSVVGLAQGKQMLLEEGANGGEPSIEIESGHDCFKSCGTHRNSLAAPRLLPLAKPEQCG